MERIPMEKTASFDRYNQLLCKCSSLGIRLDYSRMRFEPEFFKKMEGRMQAAYVAMDALEAGSIANPDENRMVGHYWLRKPSLAPAGLADEITGLRTQVLAFASDVHKKVVTAPGGIKFTDALIVGIGGSALGPQLISDVLGGLGGRRPAVKLHFLDNTDPDGIARELKDIGTKLKSTLVLVISKSGGTPETRNGMLEVMAAFSAANLAFAKQAVAVTGVGSKLDQLAVKEGWLARFPMWDWVGGRTSVTAAVGLLPAALAGFKIDDLLDGAAKMDELTRRHATRKNPAALLALMWFSATNGKGEKDMVVLPYKDRLLLFSRYLQQLVMESLGKAQDLAGNQVNQGIAVYGNKGSTDQHAYVQQLREGVNNFFATFIVVLQDTSKATTALEVDPLVSSGDYLNGFWLGTREALYENGRDSMSIICEKLDAKTLGALIALYERAVGLYALLINVNAYHQPGVEAGKKAAAAVLELQVLAIKHLEKHAGQVFTSEQIAANIGHPAEVESVFHICEHLAVNKRHVQRKGNGFSSKV
jgi:glucose-6-phosphate isomerase